MAQLSSQRVRTAIGWIAGVSLSAAITLALVSIQLQLPDPLLFSRSSIGAFLITGALAILYIGWGTFDGWLWPWLWRRRFKSPVIAVLKLGNARPIASNFQPADWFDWFKKEGHSVRYFRAGARLSGIDVMVNPYGEGYPEENALRLKSFEEFEEFVFNGGIFVSIGGYAFFYALDTHSGETVALAPLSIRYQGTIQGQAVHLQPALAFGEKDMAQGTILATRFKLLTTLGGSETVQTSQEQMDIEFAGNLSKVGGTDNVEQFRATQSPVAVSHPILRANSPTYGPIYPLIALRFGRGLFVIGGMLLNVSPPNDILSRAAFEKSCRAVANVVSRIADKRIEAHMA